LSQPLSKRGGALATALPAAAAVGDIGGAKNPPLGAAEQGHTTRSGAAAVAADADGEAAVRGVAAAGTAGSFVGASSCPQAQGLWRASLPGSAAW